MKAAGLRLPAADRPTPAGRPEGSIVTEHEHNVTPALEAAAQRRREVRDALFGLEEAISSPARDLEPWRARVAAALDDLERAFEVHVEETEHPGGLYDEMETMAPHLAGKARRLREDHPAIRALLADERHRFDAPIDEAAVDGIRDDLQRLMGRIVRHRQHGSDLVWEAYAIDIGGAG
jgi:hypothetical protein